MDGAQRIRWRGDSEDSACSTGQPSSRTGSGSPNSSEPILLSPSPSPTKSAKIRQRSPYPSSHVFASTETVESGCSSGSSLTEPEEDLPPPSAQTTPLPYLEPHVIPATSRDFSELFPSTRKLLIHHDDTTLDGNMNLRIDTPVTTPRGLSRDITLFHLRMYNLKCRDFSLRRYCRDSGREICHCVRKSHRSMLGARPNIQRSLSNAFAAMKPKSESRQHQQNKRHSTLIRHDSGYDTMHSDDENELERPHSSHSNKAPSKDAAALVSLEFSNYAHVDLKRRGFKADKRYDFDYWGCSYSWHRSTHKMGNVSEVSYHLTRRDGTLVARIDPEPRSEKEVQREENKGGWVPPSSLRILDKQINDGALGDVADVVVSTGLIALTDDCIRRRFQHKRAHRRGLPLSLVKRHEDSTAKGSTKKSDSMRDKAYRKLLPNGP